MPADFAIQLAGLLGQIYDAALAPEQWPDVFAAIRAAVGAEASAFFHYDATSPAQTGPFLLAGYAPDSGAVYTAHFVQRDVRMPRVIRTQPGHVYADDRDAAFSTFVESEIFHDFYRPLGLGHGMAARLFADASRTGLLSVHRPLSRNAFQPEEVAFFETLTPHLIRALQVQRQLNRARGISQGLAVGLDHFQLAVFLVDRDSTVLEMNQAAADLLRRPDCPLRYESRRLRTAASPTTALLHASIRRAVETIRGGEAHGPAMLRLPKADGSGVIGVMVAPVRRGDTLGLAVEPLVLVFASDPSDKVVLGDEALMQLFGLSAAEASVAISLVNGDSVEEIADQRAVSRETVRVQVKSALGKTDTHSQGQLIALVTRSLAMLRKG